MHAALSVTARHRRTRKPAWIVLLALAAAACQAAPSPSPTHQSPQVSHGAAESARPTTAPATPTPTAPSFQPSTSAQKIAAALELGEIDGPTSLLYRVFAMFGDPRLPEKFRGEPEHDQLSLALAHEQFDELPPAVQEQIAPFLVRPSDPASTWNTEPVTTGSRGTVLLAAAHQAPSVPSVAVAAPACDGTWMHGRVSSNIPVMIWAQCTGDPAAAAARWEEARGYMAIHYGPVTTLMGDPLLDANVAGDGYADTAETGDGLIDIYLVSAFSPSGHPRDFSYGSALAVTATTPPFVGAPGTEAASSYIVVSPGLTGIQLESTLVHEFFHALQFAHNYRGTYECPVRRLGGCSSPGLEFHWFVEASAKWSEEYFVPRARPALVHPFWSAFVTQGVGLADTVGLNEYASFAWPLFMQQEGGATKIADAWRAMVGKKGWRQLQAALDGAFPFTGHFRDFGVRVFNRELLPGDPVTPRFRSPTLDPTFPTDSPTGYRYDANPLDDLIDPMGGPSRTYRFRSQMDFLWTMYLPIEPPPGARKLTLDFTAFGPEIDVDAIVRIGDTGWERRKLIQGENVWCLDKPLDDFREGFLVFSNHDQTPQVLIRDWAITAEEAGCGVPVGTLVYSFLDTAPLISAPGGSSAINATVQVRLKPNPNISDPYNAMFLNDGSTYGVQVADKVLVPPGPDGCQASSTSIGTPGGALEIDSVVGNTWQDDAGRNRLTLGIDLPVHYETDEFWCSLGSTRGSREGWVTYPACDGIETSSTISTQTFVFNCDVQGTSQAWSVSGTIIINR